jgi:hypothetical protein
MSLSSLVIASQRFCIHRVTSRLSLTILNRIIEFRRTNSRSAVSVLLVISLLLVGTPPVAAQTFGCEVRRYLLLAQQTTSGWTTLVRLLGNTAQGRGVTPPNFSGVRPERPWSRAARSAQVSSISTNVGAQLSVRSREPLILSGVPLDLSGNIVSGVSVEWQSNNREVVFIKKNGQAVAGRPGNAIVTGTAGGARTQIHVTVVAGSAAYGGKKRQNSTRSVTQRRAEETTNQTQASARKKRSKRHHPRSLSNATPSVPALPMWNENYDPLPDTETNSLYQPSNNVGSPPGKKLPGGMTASSAVQATESGNKNFSFGLPIVGLPGRGIDVNLALRFNSLVYNKSTSGSSTWLTYDVDNGYPAPGFRLGYGQLEDQGANGFTLVDATGTRHALVYTSTYNYKSTDGLHH